MRAAVVTFVCLLSVSLSAQWAPFVRSDVPRDRRGQAGPRCAAAAARRTARSIFPAHGRAVSRRAAGSAGRWCRSIGDAPPLAAFVNIGQNMKDGLPLTPWAADLREAADGRQLEGQPGRELPADRLHAAPHALAAAQGRADEQRPDHHVRVELRPAEHLHRRPAAPVERSAAVVVSATRSGSTTATRSSSRRSACGTTAGSTSTARRLRTAPRSPSGSAGRRTGGSRSTSPSTIRRRTRGRGRCA